MSAPMTRLVRRSTNALYRSSAGPAHHLSADTSMALAAALPIARRSALPRLDRWNECECLPARQDAGLQKGDSSQVSCHVLEFPDLAGNRHRRILPPRHSIPAGLQRRRRRGPPALRLGLWTEGCFPLPRGSRYNKQCSFSE